MKYNISVRKENFVAAAIVAAATVGDGVFALPFVFYRAGWALGLAYLLILGVVVVAAHVVYFKTLEVVGEKKRLLGLAKEYLGTGGYWVGFFSVVAGLLLVLVAYLVLGTQFVRLVSPSIPPSFALFLFWFLVSIPVFLSDYRITILEISGIVFTSAIIIFIFGNAFPNVVFSGIRTIDPTSFFLPFGAVLFSLAGWTGIEPAYESHARYKIFNGAWKGIALGTIFAVVLKIMFVTGVLGSASEITVDTISGLFDWPLWKREVVAILGLLAVWTIFLPISQEIKNSLEGDLGWSKNFSRGLIVFLPLLLVVFGLNNFLVIVEIVGGVFLSIQYLLIISVGRRALSLSYYQKFFLDFASGIFLVAAVYQIWVFIVR